MGQASRRGTFEQRRNQSLQREQAEQDATRAKWELREQQEKLAWKTMVWWQREMTFERYNRISQKRARNQLALASLFGILLGSLGFSSRYR